MACLTRRLIHIVLWHTFVLFIPIFSEKMAEKVSNEDYGLDVKIKTERENDFLPKQGHNKKKTL